MLYLVEQIKIFVAVIKIVLAAIISISIATSSIHLANSLSTVSKINSYSKTNFYNSQYNKYNNEISCKPACFTVESESSCCKIKSSNNKNVQVAVTEGDKTSTTYTHQISEVDLSLWVEYYNFQQQEKLGNFAPNKTKESKISIPVFTKSCFCDSQSLIIQIPTYPFLVPSSNDIKISFLISAISFEFYGLSIVKNQNYKSIQPRAPPTNSIYS